MLPGLQQFMAMGCIDNYAECPSDVREAAKKFIRAVNRDNIWVQWADGAIWLYYENTHIVYFWGDGEIALQVLDQRQTAFTSLQDYTDLDYETALNLLVGPQAGGSNVLAQAGR